MEQFIRQTRRLKESGARMRAATNRWTLLKPLHTASVIALLR